MQHTGTKTWLARWPWAAGLGWAALWLAVNAGCSSKGGESPLFAAPPGVPAGAEVPQLDALIAAVDSEGSQRLRQAPVLALCVLSPECPATRLVAPRLRELTQRQASQVDWLVVNAGRAGELAAFANEFRLTCPLIHDRDAQIVRALGTARTPTFYVFDRQRRLIYSGPLDDSTTAPARVRERLLEGAIEAVLKGSPAPPSRPAVGRPIDWSVFTSSSST